MGGGKGVRRKKMDWKVIYENTSTIWHPVVMVGKSKMISKNCI